ncbi:MAG: hypothetical protein ACP5QO_07575 [Clostridia bacterium]
MMEDLREVIHDVPPEQFDHEVPRLWLPSERPVTDTPHLTRVVFDTNVVVSASRADGGPLAII